MTASELKRRVLGADPDNHFFDRATMRAFGDTMRNFGVRTATVTDCRGEIVDVWELYRRRGIVQDGNRMCSDGSTASYWTVDGFRQVFARR